MLFLAKTLVRILVKRRILVKTLVRTLVKTVAKTLVKTLVRTLAITFGLPENWSKRLQKHLSNRWSKRLSQPCLKLIKTHIRELVTTILFDRTLQHAWTNVVPKVFLNTAQDTSQEPDHERRAGVSTLMHLFMHVLFETIHGVLRELLERQFISVMRFWKDHSIMICSNKASFGLGFKSLIP